MVLTSPGSGTMLPITATKRITGGITPSSALIISSTRSPTSPASTGTSDNGQSNTRTIIGGVVGGVAGVAFTSLFIWWLVTRSRRKKFQIHQRNDVQAGMGAKSELDATITHIPYELSGMSAAHQLTAELPEN